MGSSRALESQRKISEPNFRYVTPTIELTAEPEADCGYSSQGGARSRSLTPGNLTGKTRRTTFPLLCSRPGSSARKKSFLSSEDLWRTTGNNIGKISGLARLVTSYLNDKCSAEFYHSAHFKLCIDYLVQIIYAFIGTIMRQSLLL